MDRNRAGGDAADRAAYWRGLVRDWAGSGLSQTEFCRRRRVSPVTFSSWKRRLGTGPVGPSPVGAERPRFVELVASGPRDPLNRPEDPGPGGWHCEFLLRSGRVLRLAGDFDPQRVRELIAIGEASC